MPRVMKAVYCEEEHANQVDTLLAALGQTIQEHNPQYLFDQDQDWGSTDDELVLYAVCNDYTLELDDPTHVNADLESRYVWKPCRTRPGTTLGIEKSTDEIHFLRGPAGLEGEIL
jgi:hypothetical protein